MQAVYSVRFKKDAKKELFKVARRDLPRVMERLRSLRLHPRPSGCKKLADPGHYRVRQGDWRIVYQIDDRTRVVRIFKIGHRREVYR